MRIVLAIAIGGAMGAVSRHYAAVWVMRALGTGFPFGTLAVNVLGSFLMGVLAELLALKVTLPLEIRALFTVGFLGAFTTFSTFSLEAVLLIERHQHLQAALYVGASVLLCVGGLMGGLALVRMLA